MESAAYGPEGEPPAAGPVAGPARRGRARPRRRRRRVLAAVLLGLVVAGVAVLALAGRAALAARSDLQAARGDLERAVGGSVTDRAALQAAVDRASARTSLAARRLDGPAPRLVAAVPVLGRSLAAERDVARAGAAVLEPAGRLLPLLDAAQVDGGRVDVAALQRLSDALSAAGRSARPAVERLQAAPLGLTPPQVRDAVAQARTSLGPVPDEYARAGAGLRAAAGLLGASGPRTVVVAVMNNAEARGAGGYTPSFAVATARDGRLEVGPFTDVNTVEDGVDQARRVPAPADYARRWGRYLADTTRWKNAAMSPDDPATAQVVCGIARLAPGVPCDAVVLLDVPALASAMTLSGPVRIGDEQVGGDQLVQALLVEAYADAEQVGRSQAERRRQLLAAADAGLRDLLGGRLTGLSALRLLGRAAAGRHLAVWSARPEEQRDLVAAGVSGSADPGGADLSLVSLNQMSAGKLDYYLRRQERVDVVVRRGSATVRQRVRFTLDAPPGLPAYVLGVKGGELQELVDLGAAAGARDVTVLRDGRPEPFDVVPDTGSSRVTVQLLLTAPASTEVVVQYTVPLVDGRYRMRLLPQPLARDAALEVRVRAADGLRLRGTGATSSGPFSAVRDVDVVAERPGWWDRRVELP